MIWGREANCQSFGRSLYELAVLYGYLQVEEKIFAADGEPWCWSIKDQHFSDADRILDWYHASELVWTCANELHAGPLKKKEWAQAALAAPIQSLVNYIRPRLGLMNYPTHRAKGHAIGTGLMEATAKQLVGERPKGSGMHWSEDGATHMTALRTQDLNGHRHHTWKTLARVA